MAPLIRGKTMARESQVPVGSRWMSKTETKGRVFFVIEHKGFGRLDIMQEGRANFSQVTQKSLLENWHRLPGKTELPK